jgi:hypothetical protein
MSQKGVRWEPQRCGSACISISSAGNVGRSENRMCCLYRLGRSLSACAFSLHFNWSSLLQLPPFCLVYNYSFFQFICFRLLSSIQYSFLSMFLSPPACFFVCPTLSFRFTCALSTIWDILPVELAKTVDDFDFNRQVGHDRFLAHRFQCT